MNGFCTVIPAKAGIQCPKAVASLGTLSLSQALDSGFRRSDAVVSSYAIAMRDEARALFVLPPPQREAVATTT